MRHDVFPALGAVRAAADKLETIVSDDSSTEPPFRDRSMLKDLPAPHRSQARGGPLQEGRSRAPPRPLVTLRRHIGTSYPRSPG